MFFQLVTESTFFCSITTVSGSEINIFHCGRSFYFVCCSEIKILSKVLLLYIAVVSNFQMCSSSHSTLTLLSVSFCRAFCLSTKVADGVTILCKTDNNYTYIWWVLISDLVQYARQVLQYTTMVLQFTTVNYNSSTVLTTCRCEWSSRCCPAGCPVVGTTASPPR